MQAMTATLVRHLNEQGYNFSIITIGISSHVCCPLGEKGVRLLSLFIFFFCGSVYLVSIKRNQKRDDKHLVKLNQRAKIP